MEAARLQQLDNVANHWLVLAVTTAALPLCGLAAGKTAGSARIAWIVAVLVAALATATIAWVRSKVVTQSQEDARASQQLAAGSVATFLSTGETLSGTLGELCSGRVPPAEAFISLAVLVLAAAQARVGQDANDNRATLYLLEQGGLLRRYRNVGGHSGPPPEFIRRDKQSQVGRGAVAFVEEGNTVMFYGDLDVEKPDGYVDLDGQGYKAFMAAPVRAGERRYGMLLVESQQACPWSKTDKDILGVLAGLVGAGRAVVLQQQAARGEEHGPRAVDNAACSVHPNGAVGSAAIAPNNSHGVEETADGKFDLGGQGHGAQRTSPESSD